MSVLPHTECSLDSSDRVVGGERVHLTIGGVEFDGESPSNFVGPSTVFSGACFICSVYSLSLSLTSKGNRRADLEILNIRVAQPGLLVDVTLCLVVV